MQYAHLFGPVRSRRLHRSLGIDLVPLRICTFNCVYCECGTVPAFCTKRRVFFDEQDVISELEDYLIRSPPLDFLTFSGSGEPTLSLSIGHVIRFLKQRFPEYRVAVLTNGSLLWDPAVRNDLLAADIVLPTLSSVNEETFRAIHRPAPEIRLNDIIEGINRFRKEYSGAIWLEVFVVPGLNTTDDEVAGLRGAIRAIRPDRVQLNTLDRPGTEGWVRASDARELERIRSLLDFPETDNLALPGVSVPLPPLRSGR
ncbi:MAG TPA: radical SAM protein [Methanoregulaceae archaeon]|nr:radical SAM protein [Methanoregulaceae archaeon]